LCAEKFGGVTMVVIGCTKNSSTGQRPSVINRALVCAVPNGLKWTIVPVDAIALLALA
jgi:hypothetical protein